MFSYTDDAIVTSSPTGRHLSTVIRRPAAIGPLDWNEHADQVCKVLNELGTNAKAAALAEYMLNKGPVYRIDFSQYQGLTAEANREERAAVLAERYQPHEWRDYVAELRRQGLAEPYEAEPRKPAETCALLEQRIAELEKQLDDATAKLAAAESLRHLKIPHKYLAVMASGCPGTTVHFKDQLVTIESV